MEPFHVQHRGADLCRGIPQPSHSTTTMETSVVPNKVQWHQTSASLVQVSFDCLQILGWPGCAWQGDRRTVTGTDQCCILDANAFMISLPPAGMWEMVPKWADSPLTELLRHHQHVWREARLLSLWAHNQPSKNLQATCRQFPITREQYSPSPTDLGEGV